MLLKYTGNRDARSISREEFAAIIPDLGGPIDNDDVVWDEMNLYTADVKNATGEWLLQNYANQFEKTTKKEHEEELKAAAEDELLAGEGEA